MISAQSRELGGRLGGLRAAGLGVGRSAVCAPPDSMFGRLSRRRGDALFVGHSQLTSGGMSQASGASAGPPTESATPAARSASVNDASSLAKICASV